MRALVVRVLATVVLTLCVGMSTASARVFIATGPYTDIGPVEGNTVGGATVDFSSETADTSNCDHSPGVFPVGVTTVNCTGDPAGDGSFDVTVVDTTSPAISLPGNQTA